MKLTFSPMRSDATLTASVAGDVLTLNGKPIDLTSYSADPETPHDWIIGQPELVAGVWHVTLILPHGADASEEARFPEPMVVGDGPVMLPGCATPEVTEDSE